jgi:glycosyltransferase involved in cell wall biosynthesis
MKINLIGPSYPFRGGISHYTTLLYKNLKQKHSTRFYSFKRQYPKVFFPGKTDMDISDSCLKDDDAQPILDSLNPVSWVTTAWRSIRSKPEITIFPWWVTYWALPFMVLISLIKLFSRSKILFICHNTVEHESNQLKNLISRIILSSGDFFVVHSSEEKENLAKLIGRRKIIKKIHHPTYSVFNTKTIPKEIAKKEIHLDGEKVLLFFGFVRKYKGLKYLLEAMNLVKGKMDVKLLIAGEFWGDRDVYQKMIKDLKIEEDVMIRDMYIPNEEIPHYFYASDLVVLPYVSATGSGLVQLAFGFTKPVIASRVGALSEVVEDNMTGFLVTPKNPEELARAIERFYEEDFEKSMLSNIKAQSHRFSWDNFILEMENIIKDCTSS